VAAGPGLQTSSCECGDATEHTQKGINVPTHSGTDTLAWLSGLQKQLYT